MIEDIVLKRNAVVKFLRGQTQGKYRIRSFQRLVMYLTEEKPLGTGIKGQTRAWTESEAESDFNKYAAIIRKSARSSTRDVMDAYMTIFDYLTVLSEDIDGSKHFMPTAKTETTVFDEFDRLNMKMDRRDDDITAILTEIKAWMTKYGRILDHINDEWRESKTKVKELGQN